jgi:hypothetical protein
MTSGDEIAIESDLAAVSEEALRWAIELLHRSEPPGDAIGPAQGLLVGIALGSAFWAAALALLRALL